MTEKKTEGVITHISAENTTDEKWFELHLTILHQEKDVNLSMKKVTVIQHD